MSVYLAELQETSRTVCSRN